MMIYNVDSAYMYPICAPKSKISPRKSKTSPRKSTTDPLGNQQPNQLQIPRGNQMQIPKPPQLSGTNLNLKNNWRCRVIELTILSQMHFSEFNLEAWLCLNLVWKVVGRPRRWGPGAQIPQKSARNQREINRRSPGK